MQKENEALQIEKTELETKIRTIQRDILQKESSINDLQAVNSQLKAETEIYKKKTNGGSADISKYIKQMEETQLNHKAIEDKYKARIDELLKELNEVKLDLAKKGTETTTQSNKTDINELSIENEKLNKKIKELESKTNKNSKNDCQCDDLRNQVLDLKTEKDALSSELAKLAVNPSVLLII